MQAWNREYRANNYKAVLKRTAAQRKRRRLIDPVYVIKDRLRARLKSALKRKGATKPDTTFRLTGCLPDELFLRLGAVPAGCAIDHIFPFELYNMHDPADVRRVMHYSNLQILTEEENRSKGTQLPTKAMADRAMQREAWPTGITWDMLPDRYDGWVRGCAMR